MDFSQQPAPILVGVDELPPSSDPVDTPKFGGKPRASWNLGLEKALVDILHDHNNTYHKSQNGWSSETWNMMVKLFHARHTYVKFTKSQIQDKEKDLKRDYRMLKEARMQSGVGWNENEFKLQAEPHLWENLEISFGQRIKRFKTKYFPLYESLGQLYEGNIAQGKFNFTSSSAPLEDATEIESDAEYEAEKDTEREAAGLQSEDDMQIIDEANATQSRTQVEREEVNSRKVVGGSRKKPKNSPKKRNADGLVQVMERLVHIKEKEANKEATQDFSISKCLDAFKTLEGVSAADKIPALEVFKAADNREIFVNLAADKDGTDITWLHAQIAKLT